MILHFKRQNQCQILPQMFDNHAKNIAGEGELGQASGTGGARRRLEHLSQPGPLRGLRGEGSSGAERVGPQRLLQLGRHRAQRDLQRRSHRRGMERGSCLGEECSTSL